jgi:putative transposase
MPRIPRAHLPQAGIFHITARGTGGISIFHDEVDRERFRSLVERGVDRFGWRLHAWCLMGTHFHLLIEAPLPRISAGMHRLAGLYAQGFNKRWARKGHLFEERFSCWVIRDAQHFLSTIEYILDNPVRAGLCADRRDWQWSWPRFELPAAPRRPWPYEPGPGDCPSDTARGDAGVRTTWTSPGP